MDSQRPPIIALDGLAGHPPAGRLGAIQSAVDAVYPVALALWIAVAAIVAVSMVGRVVIAPLRRARRMRSGPFAPPGTRPATAWGRVGRWLPYAILILPPLAVVYVASINLSPGTANTPPGRHRFERVDRQLVADVVAAAADGTREPPKDLWLPTVAGSPTYVALRRRGKLLGAGWTMEDGSLRPLAAEVDRLCERTGRAADRAPDTVEVAFGHSHRDVGGKKRLSPVANVDRGLLGIELSYGDAFERIGPTEMLARNLSAKKVVDQFIGAHRIGGAKLDELRVRTFAAEVVLVTLGRSPRGDRMVRGNELVEQDDVTRSRVERLAELEAQWMLANLMPDGRMTYHYAPSRTEELAGNNMIRQWMATIALERIAARRNDPALWARAAANIDYNLAQFYAEVAAPPGEPRGVIRYDGTVKLGALSLAALAIVEHPERARWHRHEQALHRTIDSMWHEDGSFQTFYEPADRTGQNNFYPGETLLLWGTLLERDPTNAALLDRFMRSFRYYKRWHLTSRNRNPAFIPWHTRAYYKVWRRTRDAELAKFVFEMNDWLLGVQQWSERPSYPDTQGRFFDPERPFGPPHSSSDGVYLEGLIDAHSLAVALGDRARAESYRVAIVRGLRNLLQLQFADDLDMFYVGDRERVRGGIRTTVYDNRIRCDNVQHTLMGVFDILDRWEDDMFAIDRNAVFASVEIEVHPALAARFVPGGALLLRLRRIDDGQTVWSLKDKVARLPRRLTIPASALRDARTAPLFLDASYRPPARQDAARTLRGEAWGTFGKPSPIRRGQEIVLALSQLASAPPPVTPPAAPGFPSAVDAVNPILVQGVIEPHPDLVVEPGGFLHLRVLSLELGRPFAFRRFENVTFPLKFEIRALDQFYPRALDRALTHRFYIDVTYNPPGQTAGYGLFQWEPPAVAGNGWSREGVPAALTIGESTRILLDRYWTKEILRGRLERWPSARAEGWIFLSEALRDKVTADNRLVFALRSPSPTGDRLLAIKVYEDIDPARPVAYHLVDADFVGGTDPDERAYFSAWLECFVDGKRQRILIGGRASPETPISAFPHTLRIALIEESPDGPETAIPELAKVPVSPTTYR